MNNILPIFDSSNRNNMKSLITNQEVANLQSAGKLSANVSVGGNMNYEVRENETGKALFRERTNCAFNDRNRWVFAAKIIL
jgi:hypothetical protein